MELKANVFYEALKELGKLPKTLKIERITIKTDSVTGTKHKETISSDHAMVGVQCGEKVVVVDFDKLKKFVNKMKNELLSVNIGFESLCISYKNGEFILNNTKASPSATINLNSIECAAIPTL